MPDHKPFFPGFRDFQHYTITVGDLGRALEFYSGLLGFPLLGRLTYRNKDMLIDFLDIGNHAILEIFSFDTGETRPSGFVLNDLQQGPRHPAFRVASVDKTTARLKKAGVRFTLDPTDAVGGVRIAFFLDPEDNLVEILEGDLQFHEPGPGRVPAPEAAAGRPPTSELLFDHVALTVADLDRSLAFYRDFLGFPFLGSLDHADSRGFRIHMLQVGNSLLELFSFSEGRTLLHPWNPEERVRGMKHLGLLVEDVFAGEAWLKQAGVTIIYGASHALGGVDTCFFADPDGNALELINGTCDYDE